MRPSRHVLFILEYYHPHLGGVETLFKSLVDQLAAQDYKITIVTNRYDKRLAKEEQDGDVTIKRFRFYNRYLFTFLAWIPAFKFARQVDIIHTTSYNAAVPARIVAKLTGTKSVITFHEYWGDLWGQLPWISSMMSKLYSSFEQMIGRFKFDQFIAVSDFTAKALVDAGVDSSKVTRIYNGIDYSQFEKRVTPKNEQFTFLFFGRVSYSKGVDILLDAIDLILKDELDCKIQLVIPSEDTPIYKEVMKRLSAPDYNNYIEVEHDLSFTQLKHRIRKADAVIIPSYSEGFCYAAVETMAIGTPIISSGQGALAEVVTGDHVVMQSFDAEGLSVAMVEAFNNNWTHKQAVKFQLDDTIQSYLELYDRILSDHS